MLRSQQSRCQLLSTTEDVLISPLLTQTVLWMSAAFFRVYVVPNQSLYSQLEVERSPQLFQLYSDTAVQQIVATLVELTNTYIHVWPFEENVLDLASDNVTAIVRAGAAGVLVSLPNFQELFSAVCAAPQQNVLARVNSQSRAKIMECIAGAVLSVEHRDALQQLNHFVEAR